MSFFSLMNKYKVSREQSQEHSHVSMLPYGGLYNIPDDELEEFYEEYNKHIRDGAKYGILEKPKNIGPMIVDIDISKPLEEMTLTKSKERKPKGRLYTNERVKQYVKAFQERLANYTDITDHSKLECYVLEKRPYIRPFSK